jgi:hypothetical protein
MIQCTHPVDCILNPMQPSFLSQAARSAYKFMGLVPLVSSSESIRPVAKAAPAAAAPEAPAISVLLSGIGALTELSHHLLNVASSPLTQGLT